MDELVEEILLRIPPDDPARLVRAALACKRWCRIASAAGSVSSTAHPLCSASCATMVHSRPSSRPPPSACPLPIASTAAPSTRAMAASSSRVQSWERSNRHPWEDAFHVWDPITGERRELPVLQPGPVYPWSWNAAVLCATDGCDHLDCHRGPFLVVFVGSGRGWNTSGMCAHVYSSEADAWNQQISAPNLAQNIQDIQWGPSALAENALYFRCWHIVLKYDLATRELSLIDLLLPDESNFGGRILLMASEDGGLGVAYICSRRRRLYLLSRKAGPDGGAGWARKVINSTALLPADDPPGSIGMKGLIGFAHGHDVFFVRRKVGIFTIDLKSMRVTKVCEEGWCDDSVPLHELLHSSAGSSL